MLIWGLLAVVIITANSYKIERQHKRITDLQKSLFNYQTRYENIYEKAYMNDNIPSDFPIAENDQKKKMDSKPSDQTKDDKKISKVEIKKPLAIQSAKKAPVKTQSAKPAEIKKAMLAEAKKQDTSKIKTDESDLAAVTISSIKIVNVEKQKQINSMVFNKE